MHTLWKGSLIFGLVSIPVKLHTSTDEKDISYKYLHRDCSSHVRNTKSCKTCQRQIEQSEIVKGYEYENGKFISFEKEEWDNIQPESSKEIQVLHFLNPKEINPIHYQKTYYLSPDTFGVNGYQLLISAMEQTKRIAICKLSIRSKESLASIQVVGNCLTISTLYYPDEIRSIKEVPNLNRDVELDPRGIEIAKLLIAQMSKPYSASQYRNEGKERLISAIKNKIAGEEIVIQSRTPRAAITDLMAALHASLEAVHAANDVKVQRRKQTAQQSLEVQNNADETA